MRLFILGANGRTGTELVDLALKQGHQVTAFVRSPEKLAIVDTRLHVIKGSLGDVEGMSIRVVVFCHFAHALFVVRGGHQLQIGLV
jgi:putative NADH-flavin reductase